MNTTLKMTSKLILVAAFAMSFVGCARNLNGEYTGTETISQGYGYQNNSGGSYNIRVSMDEASGRVHGTWQTSMLTNPSDPASATIISTGQLSGTRDGDTISDARLTIISNNSNYGYNGGGYSSWGLAAIAANCSGSFVGQLSLANDRLYGTLTSETGANTQTQGVSCTRLIDGNRSR